MRIVPKDLGLAWHVRLVLARDSIKKVGAEAPEPHLGVVGSLCTSEMGLDEKTAAALAPAAKETLSWCVVPFLPALPLATLSSVALFVAMNWPREFLPFYLGAWVLGAAATGIGWARARFRRLVEAPLTPEEVERLLEKTPGSMERRFLELVRDAVRQPGSATAEVVWGTTDVGSV